jgi:hypothetical protein
VKKLIMDLNETISYVGVTRHIPVNNRVAGQFSRQVPQSPMEYDPKEKRKKKSGKLPGSLAHQGAGI